MNKRLEFSYKLRADGFTVKAGKAGTYPVNYAGRVFGCLPKALQIFIVENYIYSRVRALNLLNWQIKLDFPRPAWLPFIDYGLKKIIPCLAEINKLPIKKLLADFGSAKKSCRLSFSANKPPLPQARLKTFNNRAVLALSFGKDSILSYGLAKELGLKLMLVTTNEMQNATGDEWKIKKQLIKSFCQEQQEQIWLFSDNVDELYYHPLVNCHWSEFNNTNSLLAYALEFLPYVFKRRAAYLLFGNERNLNDYYVNRQGYRFYPSFDQSSEYTVKENKLWSKLLNRRFQVASLVEPIYNLAEYRILYRRYPHLAKYVMSCEPDKGSKERWCYHCPMCAKTFLYATAAGNDPKKMAFNKNFFDKKYLDLYPLFTNKPLRHYERPPQVKEEQLLAFLLAYQRGWTGQLIDLFKKRYLTRALKQEKWLRKRYFGIYPAPNIPSAYKAKVLKIYRQELKNLA